MLDIRLNKDFIINNINSDKLKMILWLIANACENNCVIDGVELRRGQLLFSSREMEKVLRISRQSARTLIDKLIKHGVISYVGLSGKKAIITIVDYDNLVLTHFQPTLNTDSQQIKGIANPLPTHFEEKPTHLLTHFTNYKSSNYNTYQPTYQPTHNFEQKEKEEKKEKFPPHTPLYKEKKEQKEKFADTRMRARERKDFFNSIFSDLMSRDGLVNQYCKNNSISKEVFFELARESIEQLDFIGNKYESEQDAKKHIISTINNKIRIRKQNEQRKRQNILRREFEPAPADATNYDADF